MRKSCALFFAAALIQFALAERDPAKLRVIDGNYPRAFFFRSCEGASSREGAVWGDWEDEYSRLMGIMGKCLDEEVLGREANNPAWFSKFKEKNPEQVVLLHFNGNARDPRHGIEKYFPGHWIYRTAVKIGADVLAEQGESEIKVESVNEFKVNSGRYRTSNDDIALFRVTPDGRHDWNYCEQVQLIAVDPKKNTIRVKRGCYGTKPLAFKAGASRAAAHAVEGPWGYRNNIMWFYNFSSRSPLDAEGLSCADRLVEELTAWFGTGGKLEKFDGLEFDVLHHVTCGDTTGDGVMDNGVIDGINAYGIGVYRFAQQLRRHLGPDTIIQADGALGQGGERSQRANDFFNGIESEGWPNLGDWDFDDWSGGINRHNFWQANAFRPAFSYINHKWVQGVPGQPGKHVNPEVPFSRHRLAFAGAQFTDAVLTYAFAPLHVKGQPINIWDELNCGMANRLGWLGKPQAETICLARESSDLLHGAGRPAGEELAAKITGAVAVKITDNGLLISASDPAEDSLVFSIQDITVPAESSDLTVFAMLSAHARKGYPDAMSRFAQVGVTGGSVDLMDGDGRAITCGQCLRGSHEQALDTTTGASLKFQRAVTIAGKTMAAFTLHPPYKQKKGYLWWSRDVTLPIRDQDLRFYLGMSEKAPAMSDGIWYRIFVAEVIDQKAQEYQQVFEQATKAHEWIPGTVPLKTWSGKQIRIKFVADCGPNDNATTDQGYWGGVRLVQSGISDSQITELKSHMSWLNRRPFEASFYFKKIRSDKVDLTIIVEGSEPVLLKSITAHAAVDARYRIFEHGVVLGNPSQEPYVFDLSKIAGERTLRRIMATPTQDRKANNGKIVGEKITLGPLDGLFLMKEEHQ